MTSSGRAFFDNLMGAADPLQAIKDLVNSKDPVFEEEWREFKSGSAGQAGATTDLADTVVKETWSTALSGFANTGGGVLIWGIDCRASPSATDPRRLVDAAGGLRPVPSPDALKSRLLQLHHEATDPPVAGVVIEAIKDPAGGGYLVCYVPESPIRPHRALHVKNSPYYMRVGDDFVLMPTTFLRQLFFPLIAPRPVIVVTSTTEGGGNDFWHRFQLTVENRGTASAKDLHVRVFCSLPGGAKASCYGSSDWTRFDEHVAPGCHAFRHDRVLHPGVLSSLAWFKWNLGDGYDPAGGVWFRFQIFAENSRPFYSRLYLPVSRLLGPRKDEAVEVENIDQQGPAGVMK